MSLLRRSSDKLGCLANSGCASDSVHRADFVGIPVSQQRQVRTVQAVLGVPGYRWRGGDDEVFFLILRHFSASVHLYVEAQGGGDGGSLTLWCSATPIRCTY